MSGAKTSHSHKMWTEVSSSVPHFLQMCLLLEETLLTVNEQRNILHEIRKRKANWIGHILRRNCLLKQVIVMACFRPGLRIIHFL
jgi:hypothetical protein